MAATQQVTTFDNVKSATEAVWDTLPGDPRLRFRRAVSWGCRADEIKADGDHDAAVILYWVAFNAAYASRQRDENVAERERLAAYFKQVLDIDAADRVQSVLWESFTDAIRVLLGNKYVFHEFWMHQNGYGYDNWQHRLEQENKRALKVLAERNTVEVLTTLFDRLYVLRNQLIHGGATWNGSVNRAQVRDGARILAMLVPQFLMVMLENPAADWGNPEYPVVG